MRVYCGLPRAYDWAGFSNEIPLDVSGNVKTIFLCVYTRMYICTYEVCLKNKGSFEIKISRVWSTQSSCQFFFIMLINIHTGP